MLNFSLLVVYCTGLIKILEGTLRDRKIVWAFSENIALNLLLACSGPWRGLRLMRQGTRNYQEGIRKPR